MRITPECFDKLFILVKDNITKQITNMRDASTLKLKLAAKNISCSFICSYIFWIFLHFNQAFCLFFFASSPVTFFINNALIDIQWLLDSHCLPWFSHAAIIQAPVYHWMCSPTIKRTHEEITTGWSVRELLSSVSSVQVCYK